ncbi:alpha/beta hydrolase [Entomomonas asaccharolytica]|uniref:Alpha/beta hydrolase n=1 Tax=Entomomonas asaccharolytica TaxID=2785331 RepID=A0A974NFY8_9GAMM|nr:alpha/beta hydrolase [Entomomonas asaccharolytica]QQP86051.1 alpha/beta hydrolase [Entomomonas asaccharolytica]
MKILNPLKTTLLAGVLSVTLGGHSMAADYKSNPFTLTYDNAITENVAGRVNIHTVKYTQNQTGIEVVANIYTPANYNPANKYPAIVVAHPNGGVKEQVAGLYAQKLAEQGYITIAFDAAYQGGSSGLPRYTDKPQNRIEDIRAAADYITQYPGVDANHLGLLGICGGGGYSIKAAQTDKRFISIATVSMFNTGDARRNGFMRSQMDSTQQRLADIAKVRATEAAGGEIQYTPAFGQNMTREQVAALPFEMYRQGYEYYAQTHAHPNSQTNNTVDSLQDLMEFDVNTNVDLISQPLLMIAGEKADSLYMTQEVFANASGTDNKELFLVPNASHIETYWKQPYVQQITDKLTSFYGKNLK